MDGVGVGVVRSRPTSPTLTFGHRPATTAGSTGPPAPSSSSCATRG